MKSSHSSSKNNKSWLMPARMPLPEMQEFLPTVPALPTSHPSAIHFLNISLNRIVNGNAASEAATSSLSETRSDSFISRCGRVFSSSCGGAW